MTYAEQLNVLNASVKLKRETADRAYAKIKNGFTNEKYVLQYLLLENDFWNEHKYYVDFFTYCLRNIHEINTKSEFISV